MIPFPIDFETSARASLQERICDGIRGAILARTLTSGTRLPSSRDLAEAISVSRNTVVLAYDRLVAEGYIELRGGVGTFVSKELPEECFRPVAATHCDLPRSGSAKRYPSIIFEGQKPNIIEKGTVLPSIDFWYGRASHRIFPIEIWRRLIVENFGRAPTNLVEYPPVLGLPELRKAVAEHLAASRGVKANARNIIITAGGQEAFNIIARLFVRDGTGVAIEKPCYQGIAFALRSFGARLIPVPVDDEGMNIDYLEKQSQASLVCATPSHQFPTGSTLTLERRLRMIGWAERVGAYIIEDDYDSDFRYSDSPLPAMAGLADGSDRVIYVGTFSKSLGAGIRTGYMVLPDRLLDAATSVKALSSQGNSWLDQIVLADFLTTGAYRRHLRKLRQAQKVSRDALVSALAEHFGPVELSGAEAGMHLMWRLPHDSPNAHKLAYEARRLDVGIYPPSAAGAMVFGEPEQAFVLGYPALTESQIDEGVSRIRTAFDRLN